MQCPACEADAVSGFALTTAGILLPARCRRCQTPVVLDEPFVRKFLAHLVYQVLGLGGLVAALLWWSIWPIAGAVAFVVAIDFVRLRLGVPRVVSDTEQRSAAARVFVFLGLIAIAVAVAGYFDR
jgi:hypothetical protein